MSTFTTEFRNARARIKFDRVTYFRSIIDRFSMVTGTYSPKVYYTSNGKESMREGDKYNKYDLNIISTDFPEKSFKATWEQMERAYHSDSKYGPLLIHSFGEYLLLLALDIDNMPKYKEYVDNATNEVIKYYDIVKTNCPNLPDFIEMGNYIKMMGINEDIKYFDKYLNSKDINKGLCNCILTNLSFILALLGYKSLADVFDTFSKSRGVSPLRLKECREYFSSYLPSDIFVQNKWEDDSDPLW